MQLMKDLMLALTIETVRHSVEVASQVSMQGEATGTIHKVTHKRSKNTCNTCNKVGHRSRVCRNRKAVSEVTEQKEQLHPYFLGAVNKTDGSSAQWAIELLVGSTPVEFKINTGADVSVIQEETYHSLIPTTSEFFQIPLHPDSCNLTTFITLFGRFHFKRLPFGMTSAPEISQRKMMETLHGLEGVEVFMDDIVIYGSTEEEHDRCLDKVMQRIETAGLKLNRDKCSIRQSQL